jgi:hypothetical protein
MAGRADRSQRVLRIRREADRSTTADHASRSRIAVTSQTTAHVADDQGLTLPGSWPGFHPALDERPAESTGHPLGLTLAQEAVLGRIAVAALLLATGALYLWDLGASGWANAYYSAAALAGSQSWLAFLFGSFDAGNAITVDKTPAALWVMSLSVRIFGLSSWSLLVPQALMGVAAVGILYATVARVAGRLAGLVAGAVLALTPVGRSCSGSTTPTPSWSSC